MLESLDRLDASGERIEVQPVVISGSLRGDQVISKMSNILLRYLELPFSRCFEPVDSIQKMSNIKTQDHIGRR